jgi:hypothetical protein
LEPEYSDEEENASQQVNFVADSEDDNNFLEMTKKKRSSLDVKRKRNLSKVFL